jgi:nitric oxide reductase activation protein
MIAGLYGHAGKEEVCRSLDICAGEFRARPEGTKLLLYLHDGMPNDPIERIQATLARVRASGVTVVGLYIGPQDDLARMQVIFGQEWTIGAGTLSELPARVGRILKRYRTGR